MFFDASLSPQLAPPHNHNEFHLDIFSNPTRASAADLSADSLAKPACSGAQTVSGSNAQSRRWLVGNKIIEIKTGLFSNICLDDPTALGRKQRLSSSLASVSKPINIPKPTAHSDYLTAKVIIVYKNVVKN